MIAKINPGQWPVKSGDKKTYVEVAAEYGLTEQQFRQALVNELQSEGYCGCGFYAETSHDYLVHSCHDIAREPFHKGDLDYY